jgi:hypothetical protein
MPQLCGMLCFDLSFVKLMSAAVQPIPFEYPFPKVGAVMSFGENRVASSVQWQESPTSLWFIGG